MESGDLDGDHLVAVLTERVPDDYLAGLRDRGVSYVLAGRADVDLGVVLEKIGTGFGVRTLLLKGGGGINGGMLRAGPIDEVSLLVVPVADGRVGTPALFDVDGDGATPVRLALEAVERRGRRPLAPLPGGGAQAVSARPRAAHGATDRGADCARPGVGHRAGRPA